MDKEKPEQLPPVGSNDILSVDCIYNCPCGANDQNGSNLPLGVCANAYTEKILKSALTEIREIYIGMDAFIPETAPEAYQQWILKQMYKEAVNALNKIYTDNAQKGVADEL